MTNANNLADALRKLLDYADSLTCRHEQTHRGGSIWTICDDCGVMWEDDRGGFVPYPEPASMAAARSALAEHDAPDECFCDRMYPDSNPNASCGDCPTRDYGAQPAPRGWRLVPILATPEMDAAGKEALSANGVGDVDDSDALVTYHAMLAAAPQPAPAADGAGELPPLPEPTCLGFRNPCGITQLPDMGIYGYTSDQMHAYARAAIAAQQESRND